MCEEFAIHLSSPSIFSSLSPSSCPVDLAFSFPSLNTYISSPFLLHYLFLSHIQAANFSSVFLLLVFLFYLFLSLFLSHLSSPPLTPAPFFLARFISARCQFEFGTRATGQRVSTKNQFLNARLFRTEKPACIFPLPPSPSFISLCHCCFDFFWWDADIEMLRLAGWQNSRDQWQLYGMNDNEFRLMNLYNFNVDFPHCNYCKVQSDRTIQRQLDYLRSKWDSLKLSY